MSAARPPLAIAALAVIAVAFFALPLAGLLYRVSWQSALSDLLTPEALSALRLSLVVSIAATVLGLLLGVPLAWVYARVAFPGRNVVRALTTLPMVLPPVVGGVALLVAFGRRGLVGEWLDAGFGLRIPFTTAATVMAATFVSMPFLVLTVEAGIRSDRSPLRRSGAHARREPVADLPAGHVAAHRAVAVRGRRPLLGARAR